jgi:hypothetical protein
MMWDKDKIMEWAIKLSVNTEPLVYALKEAGLIDNSKVTELKEMKVPRELKEDPELPCSLSPASRNRKEALLRKGLSSFYVGLCFDAYDENLITFGRLAEMLLIDETELFDLAALYGRSLTHGN